MKLLSLVWGLVFAVVVICVLLLVFGVSFRRPSAVQGAALYNPANEATVKGSVQQVEEVDCPVSEGELETHLTLQTADGVVEVHLAPARLLRSQKISFTPGDQLEVVGSKVRLSWQNGIIAREITRGNESIIFRDHDGKLLLVQ